MNILWKRTNWAGLLLVAILALTAVLPWPAMAQEENEGPVLTVTANVANVLGGPAATEPVLDTLWTGDQAAIIGYQAEGPWWQVQLTDSGIGWVRDRGDNLEIVGDVTPFTNPVELPVTLLSNSKLVFQTNTGGNIHVVDVDPATGIATSEPQFLTTGIDPAISPDGQTVAFTRWDNSLWGTTGSLWLIGIDGSNERMLADGLYQPRSVSWSPDGSEIALNVVTGGRTDYEYKCTSEPPSAPIDDPLGDDGKRSSGIDVVVEWEEDGDRSVRFCYTLLPRPYWGVEVMNVATGEGEIVPTNVFAFTPTWDPANAWRIVYRDDEKGLVSVDIVEGTGFNFTPDLERSMVNDMGDHGPVFSPDGSQVAVSYWQNDHWDIHTLNADGLSRVRLTSTPAYLWAEQTLAEEEVGSWNNAAPAWSTNGSKIAFVTDRDGEWDIWVMNADGSQPHPLFPDGLPENTQIQYDGMGERMMSWR